MSSRAWQAKTKQVDQPIAALIKDLRQRGLLDSTLVVWSAEFGRTPFAQGKDGEGNDTKAGRDHHKDAFTVWVAGGGTKGGISYGATDELGYKIAENPVHVHDFNATLLHLLGINHEQANLPLPRPAIPAHGCRRPRGPRDHLLSSSSPRSGSSHQPAVAQRNRRYHVSGHVIDPEGGRTARTTFGVDDVDDDRFRGCAARPRANSFDYCVVINSQ